MFKGRSLFFTDPSSLAPKLTPISSPKKSFHHTQTNVNTEVWLKPKSLSEFSESRNNYCEICLKLITFCPNIDANCIYCNVVCHITCLSQDERNEVFRGNWTCSFCSTDIEISKSNFIKSKSKKLIKV
jgi:hypothetical protein